MNRTLGLGAWPRLALLVALLVGASGCASRAPSAGIHVELARLADGFQQPVFAVEPPDGRLWVVEQAGRVIATGPSAGPGRVLILDITDRVGDGGERGLLGLALDPGFATNGRVYVHYTDRSGDTVLSRFQMGKESLDVSIETVLLRQTQPESNHNGGMITFGPDGFLYMALGDGGGAGDRHGANGNAQKLGTILGKILRLDVTGDVAACPSSNPFGGPGQRCEVFHYGLRNPWRFSFDRERGDLWIGDVGQNSWEEVDHATRGQKGLNFGWNVYEGTHRFRAGSAANVVAPVAEYATGVDGTCAVTGGYAYRGEAIPALVGRYVFGDYCSGTLWALNAGGERQELLRSSLRVSSFAETRDGELLVIDHGGALYRLA